MSSQVTVTISGTDKEVGETIRGLGYLHGQSVTIQPTLVVTEPAKVAEKAIKTKPVTVKADPTKVDPTDTIQNGGKSESAPAVVTPAQQATPVATPVTPAQQATPAATTKTPRQVTISQLVSASLKKVPKEKVVELLKSFGVSRAGELPVSEEERFIGAIKVLMA